MESVLKNVIKEIKEIKKFDLRLYNEYVNKYGKKVIFKVFNDMLVNSDNVDEIYDKYFAAFLSIELDRMEIDEDTYIKLTDNFGEDRVNNYFLNLLEVSKNKYEIKQKYEKIYFYIDTINNIKNDVVIESVESNTDDIVRMYLKEIGSYELLKPEEERILIREMSDLRNKIKIASFDEFDSISFDDINGVMNSITTKEQLTMLKKLVDKLSDSDKEVVSQYINDINKKNKSNNLVDGNNVKYDKNYLTKQLDTMCRFILVKEKIINSNLRLVVSIAKKYYNSKIEIMDLISEGNFGLMRAVKKFDSSRNTRLSTYATWWIRQSITRYIADNANTIRIPVHYSEKIGKYNQALKKLTLIYSDIPSSEMVAEYLGYTLEEVEEIRTIVNNYNCLSLDGFISDEEDTSFLDMLADETTTEDKYVEIELSEKIDEVLDMLDEREAEVLRYRFGFYGRIYTLEEVGQMFGVTRERIRQIEGKALRKLRHTTRARKLVDFKNR